MHESEIIALFFEGGAHVDVTSEASGIVDIPRDDCARPNARTIVTTDALVENTHFRRDWSAPEDLAHKLWNVNISDIAASGGEADWCLLNLGLPGDTRDDWTRRFARAFRAACSSDGGRLIGGDTFRSERITLSLTLAGTLPLVARDKSEAATIGNSDEEYYRYLSRAGATDTDGIYVTGTVGLSQLGFEILSGDRPGIRADSAETGALYRAAIDRHLRPQARLAWSRVLRSRADVHCMLDISDGLYPDLLRLTEANPGLHFEIDWQRLPHPGRRNSETIGSETTPLALSTSNALAQVDWAALAFTSGEELELLFTAAPGLQVDFPCTRIGSVRPAGGTALPAIERIGIQNAPPDRGSPQWFQHF